MITPNKSLGQHWLYDNDVLQDIADTAQLKSGDHVLEIGPGLGTLTKVMLSYYVQITAVEYDVNLYEKLNREASKLHSKNTGSLTLVNQDILKFDLTKMPQDYKVVANIPYYLTSNLIRVLSESSNPPISATLLIQKEVAERLCADPGQMSILAVTAQMYFDCELSNVVPAKLFTPPPKVDSQIVHLRRRGSPLFGGRADREVFRIIKAGFSNKRKTLLNSLSAGLVLSKEEVKSLLEKVDISSGSRPQELSIDEWLRIYDAYSKS